MVRALVDTPRLSRSLSTVRIVAVGATDLRIYLCDAAIGNEIATLTPTARICILGL
jgi:hypothetical protein